MGPGPGGELGVGGESRHAGLVDRGHRGRIEDLPEEIAAKDRKPRTRKPAEEIVVWNRFA